MEPSDPDASPWGRQDRPCVIHGWGCPNRANRVPRALIIEPSGEEEGREDEADECRITVVIGPIGGTDDSSNDAHHHWSKGPTPRTNGTSDRPFTTVFADPSCTTTGVTGASISRSQLIGLRYAAGSVESVRQPGAPVVRLLCHLVWQRPCAQVLGLNGQAEPLSGGNGRRGAALRKVEERTRFGPGGAYQVEEQEGELDPETAEPSTPAEQRSLRNQRRSCGGARWRAIRDNPNARPSASPLYPAAETLGPNKLRQPLVLSAGPNGLRRVPLWAKSASAAGPVSFKEISSLLFFYFLYFLF
jgi:hypothetical protein